MCTYDQQNLFGEIVNDKMELNEYGEIVHDEWQRTGQIRNEILLDEFIVMPNHFHGIIFINHPVVGATGGRPMSPARTARPMGCGDRPNDMDDCRNDKGDRRSPLQDGHPHGPQKRSLGSLMAGFKSAVTKRINKTRKKSNIFVWQRNYHERIIRNDIELNEKREYIRNNPVKPGT